jgi:hypothetical protein
MIIFFAFQVRKNNRQWSVWVSAIDNFFIEFDEDFVCPDGFTPVSTDPDIRFEPSETLESTENE